MAQITNTYETYDAQGIREELSEQIFRISPEETPFVSNIGRESVDNTYYEWQNDALGSTDLANNQKEGEDYTSFAAAVSTARLGNYAQISAKTLIVSGTQDRVKKAGRKSELAYQLALRGAELKRDIESIACQSQLALAGSGNGATNRKTAGFEAFLRTNVSRGASGASSTLSGTTNGYPNAALVDGTQRAWSETLLKTVAASIWTNGGTLKMLIVGATQKQNTSAFAGIATNRFQITTPKAVAIIGSADVYVSDFGELQIVPSRFSRNRSALFLDPDRASLVFLRPMAVTELAKTGDAEKRLLLAEWGLKVYHEGGHGVVADLT